MPDTWRQRHANLVENRAGVIWRGTARALSWAYGLGAWTNSLGHDLGWSPVMRLPAPVIGVGNLAAGGTGKTPLVMQVVETLQELGLAAGVISRGYGGRPQQEVTLVSRGNGPLVPAWEAGDEPVLMARRLAVPVAVGADRVKVGGRLLEWCGPRVLVGDDLMQHRRLYRDLNLVALDAAHPLGNGALLPRGVLREGPGALRRAQAVVLTRCRDLAQAEAARAMLEPWLQDRPVLACRHGLPGLQTSQGVLLTPGELAGCKVAAFCGLAGPLGFRASLWDLGLEVADFRAFADHHPYTPDEVADLWQRARDWGVQALVTSEKDAVRLPQTPPDIPLWTTRLELEFLPLGPSLKQVLLWGLRPWLEATA